MEKRVVNLFSVSSSLRIVASPCFADVELNHLRMHRQPQNEDSQARFPANQQVGSLNLHLPEEWEPVDVASFDQGERGGEQDEESGCD
ncbi:MAG: hypothetical protein ACTMHH_03410 [Nesterenkonia sp.]|uniref:Uncharacterized protein n=1 Tax=Garicola koreensis TaxID=1262554 RepID=A0A7W5TZT0_9MICC|nr:hypothetical protein [Garicola koreensis]MBB3666586.1 hypothetical protein [Garicola koreensis]